MASLATRKLDLLDAFQQQIAQVGKEIQVWLDRSEWANMARRLRTVKEAMILTQSAAVYLFARLHPNCAPLPHALSYCV